MMIGISAAVHIKAAAEPMPDMITADLKVLVLSILLYHHNELYHDLWIKSTNISVYTAL